LASKFFWRNGLKFCPRSLSLGCDRLVLERLASLLLSGGSRSAAAFFVIRLMP
jgi:hypothetical protein